MSELSRFGWSAVWDERVAAAMEALGERARAESVPARVVAELGEVLRVVAEQGELEARVAGTLKHRAATRIDLPTVGDWVLVDAVDGTTARIRAVLERRSSFVRKAAGEATEPQVVAANVDRVAIVTSFGRDVNPRRVERYLTVAWESGADPLVVVTKLDLASDPEPDLAALEAVSFGVPLYAISNETREGIDRLRADLRGGETVALLGSSGVGKSTLLNRLAGEVARVGRIRDGDGRGRHTTTHRQLFSSASGVLLIDTPGMREIQPWESEGVDAVFGDLEVLAERCRFSDCAHSAEPGCALRRAVEAGDLEADRLDGYLRLLRDAARLERRKDYRGRLEEKRFTKTIHKALRSHPKYRR